MKDWKPGDVGVTAKGALALRCRDGQWIDSHGAPWSTDRFSGNVRPLVVLDIGDMLLPHMAPTWLRAQAVEIDAKSSGVDGSSVGRQMRWLADQIEAQIQPLKPDEPTGRWAVVEDAEGSYFTRADTPESGSLGWYGDGWLKWDEINAIRILSDGVQP